MFGLARLKIGGKNHRGISQEGAEWWGVQMGGVKWC